MPLINKNKKITYILNNRYIGAIIKGILGRKKEGNFFSWVDVVLQMLSGIWLYQNIARVMSFSQFFKTLDINIPLDFPI